MTIVHTIQVVSEKSSNSMVSSTRTSKSRRYTACIVATTTEATIAWFEARRRDAQAKREVAEQKLAALLADHGLTVEEARAQLEVEASAWFKDFFAAKAQIRAEMGQPYAHVTDGQAVARLGRTSPYDQPIGRISQLAHDIKAAQTVERIIIPALGSEAVLSWHATPALAQKALSSHDAVARQGDRLTVRTDIVTVEKGR